MRRDITGLLAAVKASAVLHKAQRQTDDRGRIVAEFADYPCGWNAFNQSVSSLYGVRTRAEVVAVVQAAETLGAVRGGDITEFEQGEWIAKSDEFVICTSASIQDTKLQLEIETQTTRLLAKSLTLKVLGQTELSTELKDHEPPRFFRRRLCLGHAAIAGSISMAK
jgi:hypothetical protein